MKKHFSETAGYESRIARIERTLEELAAEHALLAGTLRKDRSKQQQARFTGIPARIRTQQSKLARLQRLDVPAWDLIDVLSEAEETQWNATENAMWHNDLASYEGRGERALRIRFGCDAGPSTGSGDLVKHVAGERVVYKEVKNLQGRRSDGKFYVQNIQTGMLGRKLYGRWILESAEAGLFKDLDAATRERLATGELTRPKLFALSPAVQASLLEPLSPTAVMGAYDSVLGTTCRGWIEVPRSDLDTAWALECITKMGPKYVLRKSYLVWRLLRTLPAQHGADAAAQ